MNFISFAVTQYAYSNCTGPEVGRDWAYRNIYSPTFGFENMDINFK